MNQCQAKQAFLAGYMSKVAGVPPSFDMWGVRHLGVDNGRAASSVDIDTMRRNRAQAMKQPPVTVQPPPQTSVGVKPPKQTASATPKSNADTIAGNRKELNQELTGVN